MYVTDVQIKIINNKNQLLNFLLYFDPLRDWLKKIPFKKHRTLFIIVIW